MIMDKTKQALKTYRVPVIIALTQWFITTIFQIDRCIFEYEAETGKTFVIKGLYLVFLIMAWSYGFYVKNEVEKQNKTYIRGVKVFFVYFVLMMIMLLILWPGTWSWDDIEILTGILGYTSYDEWQHFLSGLYQAVLLQIIPHPGGIILIQNAIISLIVAFCVVKIETSFDLVVVKNRYIDTIIKLIPFLTPPVLLYQFSGYRIGLYFYIELVMLVILICAVKDKKEWSWKYCMVFSFIAVLATCWRSESIFYLIFIPLLICLTDKRVLSLSKKIVSIVLIVVAVLAINRLQDVYLGNDDYKLVSLIGPYAAVVRSADPVEDKEQLDKIDKVVDIDKINAYPDAIGTVLYWLIHANRDGYTEEEFKDSFKAFAVLALKYPLQVFVERLKMFIHATGMTGLTWRVNWQSILLFEQDDDSSYDEYFQEKGYYPPFIKLRKAFINLLSCNTPSGEQIGVLRSLIWTTWIPMIILIYAWVNLIRKKSWYHFIIATAVIIKMPIVFITEPGQWIMYWLPFYFLGYTYLVYKILICWSEHKHNKEKLMSE